MSILEQCMIYIYFEPMKRISFRFAIHLTLTILIAILLFHFSVLLGFVPFDIVWGGRLNSRAEMIQFETVSIVINALVVAVLSFRLSKMAHRINNTVYQVLFWLMFGLFLLNTVGNLMSNNVTEKMVFTPLTAILALLFLRMALEKKTD